MCGLPLCEYDHLFGWAICQTHIGDEITLLCDQHHREKTSGLLPADAVLEANGFPYNLRKGVSKPYDLHYAGEECEIIIGSNRFSAKDSGDGTVLLPVSVDDTPLLGFILQDGHLLLNLNLFDECNHLVLQIKNNHLYYSVSPWDIQLVGQNLIIREGERKILVDITFQVPNRIVIHRGRFLRNGVEILVRPDKVLIVNNRLTYSDNIAVNVPAGLLIGPHKNPIPAIINLAMVPRYVHDKKLVEDWIVEEFSEGGRPV